jgi:SAM-dependent methyltransferase
VDRVLLSLVICCLADKEGAMDEAWRVLRPGGKALVTYPRALGFGDRPGTLRVSRRRWRTLQLRRPWRALPVAAGIVVRRHLLEKPPTVAGGPQA